MNEAKEDEIENNIEKNTSQMYRIYGFVVFKVTFNNITYYYTSYINYHKQINLIGQWVKIRTRDHTGQKSFSVK